MTCEECSARLDEDIEHQPDERANNDVRAHVATCAACAEVCAELNHERQIYAQYLDEIEATPALWSRLHAAIEQDHAARSMSKTGKSFLGVFSSRPNTLARFACAAGLSAVALLIALFFITQFRFAASNKVGEQTITDESTIAGSGNFAAVTKPLPSNIARPRREEQQDSLHKRRVGLRTSPRHLASARRQTTQRTAKIVNSNQRADRDIEATAGFLPLYKPGFLPTPETSLIVRVTLPRIALASFGLPLDMERVNEKVQVDVMLGDDGIMRAVRLVQ